MIYFITDGYFIKVGTAADIAKRMAQLQCGNPHRLHVLAVCEGDHSLEQRLHRTIKGQSGGGVEWYKPTMPLLNLVRRVQDKGLAAIQSRIDASTRLRRMSRSYAQRHDVIFKSQSTALLSDLTRQHGVRKIAQITGLSESAIRMNSKGLAQMGALGWARLGVIEPEKVTRLMRAERVAA